MFVDPTLYAGMVNLSSDDATFKNALLYRGFAEYSKSSIEEGATRAIPSKDLCSYRYCR
jgi:hypothetical protein